VLHPYYKLNYIEMAWGSEKEQAAEIAAGNFDAKNWHAEALKTVEAVVRLPLVYVLLSWTADCHGQMAEYHGKVLLPCLAPTPTPPPTANNSDDEYDRLRKGLLTRSIRDEGWRAELRRYLDDIPADVSKDTDIVAWWGVSGHPSISFVPPTQLSVQDHAKLYPTLAKIALDVLPAQASSVPCERLFSAGKEIAVARRAQLGAEVFEQLQILKSHWRRSVCDLATCNSEFVEDIDMDEFGEMLTADIEASCEDPTVEDNALMV
jgi:hypothetical protein